MKELAAIGQFPVNNNFKWRTRKEGDIEPSAMKTSHLFYTLRMIWNNFMPASMRVGAVKLYRFGPAYTKDYIKAAIRAMAYELAGRDDLDPAHRDQLLEMMRKLSTGIESKNLELTQENPL